MKEPQGESLANYADLESCAGDGDIAGEALTEALAGRLSSREPTRWPKRWLTTVPGSPPASGGVYSTRRRLNR